jgi:hypothetical protein
MLGGASVHAALLVARLQKADPFWLYSKSWANDALVQPESRAAFKRVIDQG